MAKLNFFINYASNIFNFISVKYVECKGFEFLHHIQTYELQSEDKLYTVAIIYNI